MRPPEVGADDSASSLTAGALPPLARTMVGLAILSGLRRGELFALRWKDIDEQARVLTVREAVYDGTFGTPKTEAGSRQIPLSETALRLVHGMEGPGRQDTEPDALVFAHAAGHADLAEQRAAAVDLPGVRAAGTAARDVAHVPAHLFVVVARQRRAGQGRRAADGARQRRHDVERVHAGARRVGARRRRENRRRIVHDCSQTRKGRRGN